MLVGGFNLDLLDVTWLSLDLHLGSISLSNGRSKTSSLALILRFVTTHSHFSKSESFWINHPVSSECLIMSGDNGFGHILLDLLVCDSNKLSFLHLFGDCWLCVLRVLGVSNILLLDWLERINDLSTCKNGVELLQKIIGCVRSAMHHWIPIGVCNGQVFSLEHLLHVFPVVAFLVELETVIILVHLNFLRVVPIEDFSINPAIGKVTLGVLDFVSQIQGLKPNVHFSWECRA